MAKIEGFRVQNFRALKDVTIGRLYESPRGQLPLEPLTVVLGKNGVGKSSLFDAFGFVADCLATDVEQACDLKGRGGFERLRTMGQKGPIAFEVYFRQSPQSRPISYSLEIDLDRSSRPYVKSEVLRQARTGAKRGKLFPFLKIEAGKGLAWAGSEALGSEGKNEKESRERIEVEITDNRRLTIGTLGALKEHPRIQAFRDFLAGWYLSYFQPDAARGFPPAGPQRHLNVRGDNIGNVVQFMQREHEHRFNRILRSIASKIPGVTSIKAFVTDDKRVLLRFNDDAFKDPFYAHQMSDGTLKVFAYLLLLEDPESPPFMCIEEPENGLYHKLLDVLADEFRARANAAGTAPQIFVTTHQPYFVDALRPEEVWILEKGKDGFSIITNAASIELVKNLVEEGLPLGGLWYSDYLDAR
jgi:predicted ATPase